MPSSVVALYRYPVKGFSPEPLERADIPAGGTMPFDRAYAIENGPSGFDPGRACVFPEGVFPDAHEERADGGVSHALRRCDGAFRIFRDGVLLVEGVARNGGRACCDRRLDRREFSAASCAALQKFCRRPGIPSPTCDKVVHLVNLASVRALEEKFGRPVDPLRFRPNVVIDGAPAFSELDWMEKEIRLPGLTLVGMKRTGRCAATNVDPKTAHATCRSRVRSYAEYGHEDFGIYLAAKTSGAIAVGDRDRGRKSSRLGSPVPSALTIAERCRGAMRPVSSIGAYGSPGSLAPAAMTNGCG